MNGYQYSGAGPLYPGNYPTNPNGFEINQTTFLNEQHLNDTQHQSTASDYSPTDYCDQYSSQWYMMNAGHPHITRPQHLSALSSSSGGASFRSSNHSTFSQAPTRDSWRSATSVSSQASIYSREDYILATQNALTHNSGTHSYNPSPIESPISPVPRKRSSQRQVPQVKDYFKTCVSGHKQPRPCNNAPKYFCTVCKKTFVGKSDWKRHEETYQERPEMFQCDLCPAIYFLEKDFIAHHEKSHRCIQCSDMRHAAQAKKQRKTRTGWGCGFCVHFSDNWTDRCNHIANHLEKDGRTSRDWHHSDVIDSLLRRPALYVEWIKILQNKRRLPTGWNEHSTGRVEGYPESNPTEQLQDLLEYYTPDQDATVLAQLAYNKAVKTNTLPEMTEQLLEPPPVPPKDYRTDRIYETPTFPHLTIDTESWTPLTYSILEDVMLPTEVCHLEGWPTE